MNCAFVVGGIKTKMEGVEELALGALADLKKAEGEKTGWKQRLKTW